MARYTVRQLDTLTELRAVSGLWDDLWLRSEVTVPTARAELVACWMEHFAPRAALSAWLVEQDGQLVAALPLLRRRCWGLEALALPGNEWSPAGDLLLDPGTNQEAICRILLDAQRRAGVKLLGVGGAPLDAPRWQSLLGAAPQPYRSSSRSRFDIDLVSVGGAWHDYLAGRSRNHRRYVRRAWQRAQDQGGVELVVHDQLAAEQVEPLLRACFEVERRGWKGQQRSAVLDDDTAWRYYLTQAGWLAQWGQMCVTTLVLRKQIIAFEYGWVSKRVYCSPKVGYDEAHADLSPGQLLRYLFLERAFLQHELTWVDFFGPASAATTRWATHRYHIGKLQLAVDGLASRGLVAAQQFLGHRLRRGSGPTATGAPENSLSIAQVACPLADPGGILARVD